MKIAIHHRENSFSRYWIEYCVQNKLEYKLVNCYKSDIIKQVDGHDILMWHWHHGDAKAVLFARQLIYSLEAKGLRVFPDSNTCWHFDDKVGQKYLLEAVNAPTVPSYVFYDKKDALQWINSTSFPIVFKLRGGAGSMNVKLVRSKNEAVKLINTAFSKGFANRNSYSLLIDRMENLKSERSIKAMKGLLKGLGRIFIPTDFEKMGGREKGYAYFQQFMPGNTFDTRVVIIGKRAFTIRRYNRENDFRASGSGRSGKEPELFDKRCLRIAFETAAKIKSQSVAFDFIFDPENSPRIVEMSFGFRTQVYPGYWDYELNWHDGDCNSQFYLMETLLGSSVKGYAEGQFSGAEKSIK